MGAPSLGGRRENGDMGGGGLLGEQDPRVMGDPFWGGWEISLLGGVAEGTPG